MGHPDSRFFSGAPSLGKGNDTLLAMRAGRGSEVHQFARTHVGVGCNVVASVCEVAVEAEREFGGSVINENENKCFCFASRHFESAAEADDARRDRSDSEARIDVMSNSRVELLDCPLNDLEEGG